MSGNRSKELQQMIDSFVETWLPSREVCEELGLDAEEFSPESFRDQLEGIISVAYGEAFEDGQSNYLYESADDPYYDDDEDYYDEEDDWDDDDYY